MKECEASLSSDESLTQSAQKQGSSNCDVSPPTQKLQTTLTKLKTNKGFFDSMTPQEQSVMKKHLARAVYSSCTPLSFTENKYWEKAFKYLRPAFQLPSRFQLSNTLLDEEYNLVQSLVEEKIALAESLTLMSDGWTDIQGNPLVNFVFATPVPVFFKDIETTTDSHTGIYMAKVLSDIMEKVGPHKVHALVTDNASNMKAAWRILKEQYPHLIIYGCLAHGLNLLAKDLAKLRTLTKLVETVKEIIKFFKDKHIPQQVLKKIQMEKTGKTIALLYPVDTRWGSVTKCLENVLKTKEHLQAASVDTQVSVIIPAHIRKNILDDDIFWTQVSGFLNLLQPISSAISKLEGDKPVLSEVVPTFRKIYTHFKETARDSPLLTSEEESLMMKFEKRRQFCHHRIQLAAYLLDPRYRGQYLNEEELIEAMEIIGEVAAHVPHVDQQVVTNDLAEYRAGHKLWNKEFIWKSAETTPPLTWWKGLCGSRQLSKVAVQILSFPATAAACERNWKSFSNITTKKRNRLTTAQTTKLVTVHYNLQLLKDEDLDKLPPLGPQKKLSMTGLENDTCQKINFDEALVSDDNRRH